MAARYSSLDSDSDSINSVDLGDVEIESSDSEGEEELAGSVRGYLYTPSVPINPDPTNDAGDSPAGTPQPPRTGNRDW